MTTRTDSRKRRWSLLATSLASTLVAITSFATPARAWDPSTTHLAMTQEAVLHSDMHLRWMDASGLTRGVFSPVRLHPDDLPPDLRREITVALRRVHEASGAAALGGPGACPGPSAPASTQARCVDGDVWELTALGWIKLGVILETAPRTRLLHHFVDRDDPSSPTWSDPELPRVVLKRKARRSEGALARAANRTAFAGGATSATAWLSDGDDPWAPPATLTHLQRSQTAADARTRDRELALGLLGVGALLHVLQDQSVPAHARGDLTAFFAPLSPTRGDRGLPLQEFVRVVYGRTTLPGTLSLSPRDTQPRGTPLAPTLHQHLLGAGDYPGLSRLTSEHFWSESSLPAPRNVPLTLDAEAAAAYLVGDNPGLAIAELEGAHLTPWPATTGYLRSSTGRGLAAFDTDEEGRLRLFLDRRIYRDQAAHLIPAGVEASASVLDLLFPAFPDVDVDFDAGIIDLDLREGLHDPVLTVSMEDGQGQRTRVQRVVVRAGQRNHIVDAFATPLPEDKRLVLELEGRTAVEHGLPLVAVAFPSPPAAAAQPPAKPAPATPEATGPSATEPTDEDAAPSAVPGPSGGAPGASSTRGPTSKELLSPFEDDNAEKKTKPEAKTTTAASQETADPSAPATPTR